MANKCLICCCICCAIIVGIIFLAFLGVFVGIPLAYKNSIETQREHIFPISEQRPSNPQFSNFEKYFIYGGRNLHVTVASDNSVSLGVWHLLPYGLVNDATLPTNFDYSSALAQNKYPVIIRFHSNMENRAHPTGIYNVLRNFFHVIAFDYRSYGDSSNAMLNEEGLVQDSISLYKWLRAQTRADIYFWGHGIGSAISAHTISKLRDANIMPKGLFLEAPFTSLRDQMNEDSFNKIFKWLLWYDSTMLDPLEKNGFIFNTAKHIAAVECPIMIVHAKDDQIIPYYFSEKLYKVAQENRSMYQGNVTLHLLPEGLHFDHFGIHKAPELTQYIQNHINICKAYNKGKN